MRYKNDYEIITWAILKEIKEYHRKEDIPKMTWDYCGKLEKDEEMFSLKSFWTVRCIGGIQPWMYAGCRTLEKK